MLEKQNNLRKIEVIFTDNKVHPECNYLYQIKVLEDGVVISTQNHRVTKSISDSKTIINEAETYVHTYLEP